MDNEKELKRLILDVPKEFHARIKAQCALKHITIQKYVMRAVMLEILKDEQYTLEQRQQEYAQQETRV